MMQNQNTRNKDGVKKNSVVSNGVCPDPSRKHPQSPSRNACLCIWKSFCCCGCYRFQSTKTSATTFQISDVRGGKIEREWQVLCCMIYYQSNVRTEASAFCEWILDGQCHFSFREVCKNSVTFVCPNTWNSCKRIQVRSGPEDSVTGNMILSNFLAPCEYRYIEGGKKAGRRDNRGTWVQLIS